MGKNLAIIILTALIGSLASCEDPGLTKADQNFSRSSLKTVYVDTFLIKTSTILIDSLPTSATSLLLVGKYKDPFLGNVSASTNFQIGFQYPFAPDQLSTFDSIGLVLGYSKYSFGDTTKTQTIHVHQLTSLIKALAPLPYRQEESSSYFLAATPSLYNSSKTSYDPTPITSTSVKFYPHRDSIYIPLPKAMGKSWFDMAQTDALAGSSSYFNDAGRFITEFFNGIHISADGSNASIAGFKAAKVKVRIYYKHYVGDLLAQTYFDFPIVNGTVQYNQITSDRSGTPLASLKNRQALPSTSTGNVTYVQSGVGLATKVEFPTLKSFFSKSNFVLIDAIMEIIPVQNTYSNLYPVPTTLALFTTNTTNVILNRAPPFDRSSYLSANISYDFEYGINVKYTFPLVNYLSTELASPFFTVTPLVISAPPNPILTELNRVVLGDQLNSQNKIKLKIHYSYVPN